MLMTILKSTTMIGGQQRQHVFFFLGAQRKVYEKSLSLEKRSREGVPPSWRGTYEQMPR